MKADLRASLSVVSDVVHPMSTVTDYRLYPELAAFVARSESFAAADDSLAALRAAYRAMSEAFTPPRPAGVTATDLTLRLPDRQAVRVRRYLPDGNAPANGWPGVLYLHGGGWVVGDLDSHDFVTAALAARLKAVIIAVDYRLAPEHPFPAAFDDTLTAWLAITRQASAHGLDPSRLAVAGDSAGGNLAAALCLALRGTPDVAPRGQALIYPALSATTDLPSYQEHAAAPMLSAADIAWFRDHYLPDPADRQHPHATPLAEPDLKGLPPAFIAVAEYDPLRDDGIEYARRLCTAGNQVEFRLGKGLVHGCLRARGHCPAVDRLFDAFAAALARFIK